MRILKKRSLLLLFITLSVYKCESLSYDENGEECDDDLHSGMGGGMNGFGNGNQNRGSGSSRRNMRRFGNGIFGSSNVKINVRFVNFIN